MYNIIPRLNIPPALLSILLPSTSPMPARSVTAFSPMGSATKFLCFWDVVDMVVTDDL